MKIYIRKILVVSFILYDKHWINRLMGIANDIVDSEEILVVN